MLGDKILGLGGTYLQRLGALCTALCGATVLLGVANVALDPAPDNVVALAAAAALTAAGVAVCRGN